MAIDVVCHMVVEDTHPGTLRWIYRGEEYFFCTNLCLVQFQANPEKYIQEYRQGKVKKVHKGAGNPTDNHSESAEINQ